VGLIHHHASMSGGSNQYTPIRLQRPRGDSQEGHIDQLGPVARLRTRAQRTYGAQPSTCAHHEQQAVDFRYSSKNPDQLTGKDCQPPFRRGKQHRSHPEPWSDRSARRPSQPPGLLTRGELPPGGRPGQRRPAKDCRIREGRHRQLIGKRTSANASTTRGPTDTHTTGQVEPDIRRPQANNLHTVDVCQQAAIFTSPERHRSRHASAHHEKVLRHETLSQVKPREYSRAAICVRNVDVHVLQFT
jgi:hypothetical protein